MLTERMQQWILYQLYEGDEDPRHYDPADFDEPWRTGLQAFARMYQEWSYDLPRYDHERNEFHPNVEVWQEWTSDAQWALQMVANLRNTNWDTVYRQLAAAKPVQQFLSLDEIAATLPPITWLWENWLPRGLLSMLGAVQGTGKSYLALDLARVIIDGGCWPDGTPVATSGRNVVYVEAEAVPQITAERALALGLNRKQLFPLLPLRGEVIDLASAEWQDHLTEMVHHLQPELVIVDSLSSVSSKGQNSVEDVNALLVYLAALARFGNCAVLVIHHIRKPNTGQLNLPGVSIHDFRGSGHITAMARTVLGLSVDQLGKRFSLNGPRRLELVKSNIGPYPDPLRVAILDDGDGRKRFEYGPVGKPEREPSLAEECEDWLIELLETNGEPMRAADILAEAEAAGYRRSLIFEVREKLNGEIVDTKGPKRTGNRWALASWVDDGADQVAESGSPGSPALFSQDGTQRAGLVGLPDSVDSRTPRA